MPKSLTIGTEIFEFPLSGETGNYGSEVTDWATAVSDGLATVFQPNDILFTTVAISNNISSPVSITGFSFDTAEVISINAEYRIQRTTDSPANNLVESGVLQGYFDGTNWGISQERQGDAGVTFDITAGGQVTYTSTNLTGTNYSGVISFRARVFNSAT